MLAGGNFMSMDHAEAQNLLNDLSKRESTRADSRRHVKGKNTDLVAKIEQLEQRLNDRLDALQAPVGSKPVVKGKSISELMAAEQQMDEVYGIEEVNFMRQQQQWPNTRNNPNLSYGNANAGIYGPGQQLPQQQVQQPQRPSMYDLFAKMDAKMDLMRAQQSEELVAIKAVLKSHETQIGQIAKQFKPPAGILPSNTVESHEQVNKVNAITTRGGKSTTDPPYPTHERVEKTKAKEHVLGEDIPVPAVSPQEKDTVRKSDEKAKPKGVDYSLRVPYPQRLKAKDDMKDFKKFVDIFRKLQINIPFADAIAQMPKYAKFLRDLLSNRRRMDDFETVTLTEDVSAVIQKALPKKLKDPGGFIISVTLGDAFTGRALCDLGASINLMPMSVYKQLGEDALTPTRMCLQMADRSIKRPRGVLEDVLVRVEGLIFPADFVVLDMVADDDVPLILGRPFMATGRTLIDVAEGKLTMRIEDERVDFNVFAPMKFPAYAVSEHCYAIKSCVMSEEDQIIEEFCANLEKEERKWMIEEFCATLEKVALEPAPPNSTESTKAKPKKPKGVKKKKKKKPAKLSQKGPPPSQMKWVEVQAHPVVKKIWVMKKEEARRAKPP